MSRVTVVGLPIFTLASYAGMRLAPSGLREAGLVPALGPAARDSGDAGIPGLERDTERSGVKNLDHFRLASDRICAKVGEIRSDGEVLCVGGECSLVLGSLAGLSRIFRGRPGMLWMDSHGDFNTPESSPSGYIGGMCLAMAAGRGPKLGDGVETRRPLIKEESLVHLGSRALDREEERMMKSSGMRMVPMAEVRRRGVRDLAGEVSRHLADRADWLVLHLDVDVIDPTLIPAVNYPTPKGLTIEEVLELARAVRATGKLRAVEVAAYNPAFDTDGSSAVSIVGLLTRILG